MQKLIVLVAADYINAKEVCNQLKNKTFKDTYSVREEFDILLKVEDEDEEVEQVLIYNIEDFVDGVNEQELEVLANYFMSVVNVEN